MSCFTVKRSTEGAFTLIELLVVITIIAVLAGIILPVYGSMQNNANKTQSLSNMRQLGAALLSYCGDNNGSLPGQGDKAPTWAGAAVNSTAENSAWYNALPRTYGNGKGLGDYAANPAAFYAKGSMFYVTAGKYPSSAVKLGSPQFALAFNSKLYTSAVASIRLQGIQLPAETVIFQENGLVGETTIPGAGQSAYSNQSCGYASRTAARYNGQTILTFADGHAGSFSGTSIVTGGKAYFAAYPAAFPAGAAKVYWEVDPTVSPN